MTGSRTEIVRRHFACYSAGDRAAAEDLIAGDFVFTSPQDDHVDRATFFERCFPTSDRFTFQEIQVTAEAGDDVFVMYEYQLRGSGDRYRNSELITVRDGKISESQVFFGGKV